MTIPLLSIPVAGETESEIDFDYTCPLHKTALLPALLLLTAYDLPEQRRGSQQRRRPSVDNRLLSQFNSAPQLYCNKGRGILGMGGSLQALHKPAVLSTLFCTRRRSCSPSVRRALDYARTSYLSCNMPMFLSSSTSTPFPSRATGDAHSNPEQIPLQAGRGEAAA